MTHQSDFHQKDIEIIERHVAFDGFYQLIKFKLRFRLHRGGWSDIIEREIFTPGQAVGILLYDQTQQKLVFAEQFRPALIDKERSPWLIELVAGRVDPGETYEQSACREAKEEVHAQVTKIFPICDYWPTPGTSAERMFLFCGLIDANEVGDVGGLESETEDIRVITMEVDEAFKWLDSNQVQNASTIMALQWLKLNRDSL